MTTDNAALLNAKRGTTANGVPFLALPPERARDAQGAVIFWHGADPPRTEEALAAAVPMRGVPVWRVYLGMPGHGIRSPEGGVEEIMRLAAQDALSLLFRPRIEDALAELPGAVDDLRARLGIDPALPLGLFGFSQGGAAALLAVSRGLLPFKAVVTFGATVDMQALINHIASLFGMTYEWTDERRALADRLSPVGYARALAESGAAILLGVGADDPYPTREPAERLAASIVSGGGSAEARIVPNLAHAFVDEPGEAPAPQGEQARAVDDLASRWFTSHLT
ncbi:MAG: alpha/beta hydrolase family protein [Anaerolineales bacterium]